MVTAKFTCGSIELVRKYDKMITIHKDFDGNVIKTIEHELPFKLTVSKPKKWWEFWK